MRYYQLYLSIVLALLASQLIHGQDMQFSQYYATGSYLNPALVGVTNNTSAGLQYRDQWRKLGNHFTSALAHGEHLFEKANSGVGVLFHQSVEGSGKLTTQELSGIYSFRIRLNDKRSLVPAIQGTYTTRSIDLSGLDFGDQYTSNGAELPTSESFKSDRTSFPDFSAGMMYYSPQVFMGVSAHHLTEPSQSIIEGTDTLKRKISAHGGFKIPFKDLGGEKESSMVLSTNYKFQGKADQLDLGVYFILEPITFGFWYRGLPIKTLADLKNNESIVGMAGVQIKGIRVAYSYDHVISSLINNAGAVHEISLNYEFYIKKKVKTSQPKYGLPIPMF